MFAVPVSIGIALFLTELAPRRLRSSVVTVIDLLAAIPSVVFGLWGILVVGPALVQVYEWLHDIFGGIPVLGSFFGKPVRQRSRLHDRRDHRRHHDHSDHHLDHP